MRKIAISAALIVVFSSACALGQNDTYLMEDPLAGAAQFTEKGCDNCHSIEGQGGTFGPDLARSDLDGSLLDIVALMWNHSPQMSGIMVDLRQQRPTFTRDELSKVVAYMYYIAYFDRPGDIASGMRAFSQNGCSRCHRVGGIGTRVGPSLAPIKKYVSPIFLSQMMWNHGPEIKSKMNELGVSWPEFDGPEIANLMAFLRDASPEKDPERVFMRPGNPATGQELFTSKGCIACHEVLGEGRAIGPDLMESTFHKTATSIAAVMWNHGPRIWSKMEDLGLRKPTFEDNEMADLVAFLYFLRFFESEGDVARGEMLFEQKGCQSCHHFGDADVDESFSLSYSEADMDALDVVAAMWNNAESMSEMMTRKKMDWPRIAPGEMTDLMAFILQSGNR